MARILVIDDNADLLNMLELVLRHKGNHEVFLSSEGQKGLQLALDQKPDLAIIDVMMPGMSGYDVVKQIRANESLADMSIIILTARGQPIDALAAKQAGADLHISKPVDADSLLGQIEELLSHREAQSPAAVLPLLSLRGGIGTTTLGVNLALLLQQVQPTLLLDLSPNSGHCALYLGLKPVRHWGPLSRGLVPLQNAQQVEDLTLEHENGLRLLAAPPTPLENQGFDAEQIQELLQTLGGLARFVIVDMPPTLGPAFRGVLNTAAHLFLISGDDPPGLQTTLQTLRYLKAQRERTGIIVNTVTPGPRPPLEALQRALHLPILAHLPYDPGQTTARHRQLPSAIGQPDSPLIAALQRLVRQLLK
ncbi:MAG: response regulator [Anaerolineales bacterium]